MVNRGVQVGAGIATLLLKAKPVDRFAKPTKIDSEALEKLRMQGTEVEKPQVEHNSWRGYTKVICCFQSHCSQINAWQ